MVRRLEIKDIPRQSRLEEEDALKKVGSERYYMHSKASPFQITMSINVRL